MRRKYFLILFLISFSAHMGWTQKTTVKFEKTVHDYGVIKEDAGNVTGEFKFTNTGKFPLVIKDVEASCGCTSPNWTRDTIHPGKSGFITASFNPKGRIGTIDKTIGVKTNAEFADMVVLYLTGTVVERDKIKADFFPFPSGSLRFTNNMLDFGTVKSNEKDTASVYFYNDGKYPVKFIRFENIPAHINLKFEPEVVQPMQEGRIFGKFDAVAAGDFGQLFTYGKFVTQDETEAMNDIYINANVEEYFPKLSKSLLKKAPAIKFETLNFDFGKIQSGTIVTKEFEFKNTGKSDLIIRKTRATCGCTVSQPEKNLLKPGETSRIKVTFDSAGKKGNNSKPVTVISNDPLNPIITLNIGGEIL